MAGSKKVFGLLFASALAVPVAFMGAASATESDAGVRTLVAEGSVQATAACTGAAAFSSVTYTVDGVVVPELSTGLPEGATVKVDFTLAPGCDDLQVGLAAYQTTSATWDPSQIENRELFVHQTGVFDAGVPGSLSLTVPECYYQVDFFTGGVLTELTPTTNYTSEGRLVDAGHGGTGDCVEVEETTTTCPPETTTTTAPPTTLPTEVQGVVEERPEVLGETVQSELAETGVPAGSLAGLGAALTLSGAAMTGAAMRIRDARGKHFRK